MHWKEGIVSYSVGGLVGESGGLLFCEQEIGTKRNETQYSIYSIYTHETKHTHTHTQTEAIQAHQRAQPPRIHGWNHCIRIRIRNRSSLRSRKIGPTKGSSPSSRDVKNIMQQKQQSKPDFFFALLCLVLPYLLVADVLPGFVAVLAVFVAKIALVPAAIVAVIIAKVV
jgi:hypothetical protein